MYIVQHINVDDERGCAHSLVNGFYVESLVYLFHSSLGILHRIKSLLVDICGFNGVYMLFEL